MKPNYLKFRVKRNGKSQGTDIMKRLNVMLMKSVVAGHRVRPSAFASDAIGPTVCTDTQR